MTTYNIHGTDITVSSAMENYRYIESVFLPYFESVPKQFREWYSDRYDCKDVYKKFSGIKYDILAPMVDRCISILTKNKIYTVDSTSFKKTYLKDHFDDLDDMAAEMMHKIAEIEGDQQAAANYRRMRKDSRGRWVGGGFGMSGAVKGAMGAGMMNAASGIGHSAVNALGNIGSSIAAANEKSKVYSYYKTELSDCSKCTVLCVQYALMEAMHREGGFDFETVSDEDAAKSRAMVNNLRSVPEADQLSYLLQALELDPYNAQVYRLIWFDHGDESGELKEMSDDFHTGLNDYIQNYCADFADDNDRKHCYNYNSSKNPQKAALEYEADIQEALMKLKAFCDSHTVAYTDIKYYKKYCDILNVADTQKRTVEGTVYATTEEADAMRQDIDLFYKVFRSYDRSDQKTTLDILHTQHWHSENFRITLDSRTENEIQLRDPECFFENLQQIIEKSDIPNELQKAFEIERIHESIRTKRPFMNTYAGLLPNEIPLIFLERGCGLLGSKGNGKSGFVITNFNVKIYSGAMLSKEKKTIPLQDIHCVACLGGDTYKIQTARKTANGITDAGMSFALEMSNLSIENQNKMAELLTKLLLTVQNIDSRSLVQIDRIYKNGTVCPCGTYLLPGELSCPTCHRFVQSDGAFIEAMPCPVCGKHLKPQSKFCTGCGHIFASESPVPPAGSELQKSKEATDLWGICDSCHKTISSSKKFCQYCGAPSKITVASKEIPQSASAGTVCPKCGYGIKDGKSFCSHCGEKIKH